MDLNKVQGPGMRKSTRSSFLWSIGYKRSSLDPNLYLRQINEKTAIVLLFVDNLLITGDGTDLIAEIKHQLQQKYEMKDLGKVQKYLGN